METTLITVQVTQDPAERATERFEWQFARMPIERLVTHRAMIADAIAFSAAHDDPLGDNPFRRDLLKLIDARVNSAFGRAIFPTAP